MNQKKAKKIRREFRELGVPEKEFRSEKRTRLKTVKKEEDGSVSLEPEEYDYITTKNNLRRFKKGKNK